MTFLETKICEPYKLERRKDSMENFEFILPTGIRFGSGVIEEIGEEIKTRGYKNPLIVTDKGIIAAGIINIIGKHMKDAGVTYEVFDGIVPNPRDYDCDKGAAYAKEIGADVLVAVGGGSAMDTAKTIATIMTNGGCARDWFDVELDAQSAPVICVPTTCGTGSEVTFNAVITNSDTRLKANIFDPKCAPILALVDPELIKNLPAGLVSSTGIDALTHAIEAYVCTVATPITDAIAIKAVKLIAENITKAAKEKDDAALSNVMLASMMAGIAFGNADTAGVHCIAECFGGFYDIPHGVTNSIFLADVSEFSIPGNPKKYAEVAEAMGVEIGGLSNQEAALKGVEQVRALCDELEIPKLNTFKTIDPNDFEHLAEASSLHCCNEHNPIEATKAQYLDIFKKVYNA